MTRHRNSIDGQWVPHTIEMIRSPAWSVLSLSARRVLDRIEIERADHGGKDNGRLPVTYDDFERYGIHRHQIRKAIRETQALGFAEITERGRAGNTEFRSSHKFRLTYFHVGRAPPTNEWQRIKTVEEAQALARAARREAPQKTKVQWRKMPILSGGNRHQERQFHSAETTTTGHSAETTTTSISRGGNASQTEGRCSDPPQTPPETANVSDVSDFQGRGEKTNSAQATVPLEVPSEQASETSQHNNPDEIGEKPPSNGHCYVVTDENGILEGEVRNGTEKCAQCGKDGAELEAFYGEASARLHRGACEDAWRAACDGDGLTIPPYLGRRPGAQA